jgi:glutaredoxin 2
MDWTISRIMCVSSEELVHIHATKTVALCVHTLAHLMKLQTSVEHACMFGRSTIYSHILNMYCIISSIPYPKSINHFTIMNIVTVRAVLDDVP